MATMIRVLKFGWLALVLGGGGAFTLLSLLSDDPFGAAVLAGIVLVLALATLLFPDDARPRRGFEPHRRR
jgi:hypothetical protein